MKYKKRDWQDEKKEKPTKMLHWGSTLRWPPSPLLHLEGGTVNISLSVYIRETPPEIPPWQDTRLPEIKDDQKKVFLHVECHLQKRTTEYFVLQF